MRPRMSTKKATSSHLESKEYRKIEDIDFKVLFLKQVVGIFIKNLTCAFI